MSTHKRGVNSRIEGFYRLGRRERLASLAQRSGMEEQEVAELLNPTPLSFEVADHMIENAIGVLGLPLGVGLNFLVNGRERLVPMAVEEPSVVAAVSSAARLIRDAGGFFAEADASLMIGQVQLLQVPDPEAAQRRLQAETSRILTAANGVHPNMLRRGAGARKVEWRFLADTPVGSMLIVHLVADVGDAMGANAVNSMVEAVSPLLEEITGGVARLRILSNLADQRLARATARIPFRLLATERFSGEEVARRMEEAWAFAWADPYRACTHNKGIMNGIDAAAIATGQDWRGVEAGAHAYAARDGQYRALSEWRVENDALRGTLELPLAVGTVGGNLECNPRVNFGLRMLGVTTARDLASVLAAVGLAQNFAAMRALCTDGIQRGHMALHARGLAMAAGASEDIVEEVVEELIASGEIKLNKAREIVESRRTAA